MRPALSVASKLPFHHEEMMCMMGLATGYRNHRILLYCGDPGFNCIKPVHNLQCIAWRDSNVAKRETGVQTASYT